MFGAVLRWRMLTLPLVTQASPRAVGAASRTPANPPPRDGLRATCASGVITMRALRRLRFVPFREIKNMLFSPDRRRL